MNRPKMGSRTYEVLLQEQYFKSAALEYGVHSSSRVFLWKFSDSVSVKLRLKPELIRMVLLWLVRGHSSLFLGL